MYIKFSFGIERTSWWKQTKQLDGEEVNKNSEEMLKAYLSKL